MVNIKLGDKVYDGVTAVKLDNAEGGTKVFAPYEEAFSAGKAEGYEQGKMEGNVLLYAKSLPEYMNAVFPDGYDLTLNIPNFASYVTKADMVFNGSSGIRRVKVVSNSTDDTINLSTSFHMSTIEVLDISAFSRNIGNMSSTFLHCSNLREIKGELNLTSAIMNGYELYNCTALEEIRIQVGTIFKSMAVAQSNKLSDASIQSIIDGLADLTGLASQTLTFHATVGAKLTEAQRAAITAKNWTLVY